VVSHEHCNVLNDDFVNKTSVKIYLSQMKVTSCLANIALTELHVVPDEPTRLLLLTRETENGNDTRQRQTFYKVPNRSLKIYFLRI